MTFLTEWIVFELMSADDFCSYVEGQMHEYVWDRNMSYSPQDIHGFA